MKTKQSHMKAKFTSEESNGKKLNGEKELIGGVKIVDKTSEKTIVDCRIWSTRNNTIYSSIWVSLKSSKKPDAWEFAECSGHGRAGGYGYDKISTAVQAAIDSASIELYGGNYKGRETVDFKKSANIAGTGQYDHALLAIAYAAGYNNVILVEY